MKAKISFEVLEDDNVSVELEGKIKDLSRLISNGLITVAKLNPTLNEAVMVAMIESVKEITKLKVESVDNMCEQAMNGRVFS